MKTNTTSTVAVLSEVRKAAQEEPTFLQAHNQWARRKGKPVIDETKYRKAKTKLKHTPRSKTTSVWFDLDDDLMEY